MRFLAVLIIVLLPWPALAVDEFEAHDAYVKCFAVHAKKLLPNWCQDADQLANFAHQACLKEAAILSHVARIRKPAQAVKNAQLDAKLVMFDMLRKYNANPGCSR